MKNLISQKNNVKENSTTLLGWNFFICENIASRSLASAPQILQRYKAVSEWRCIWVRMLCSQFTTCSWQSWHLRVFSLKKNFFIYKISKFFKKKKESSYSLFNYEFLRKFYKRNSFIFYWNNHNFICLVYFNEFNCLIIFTLKYFSI